MNMYSFFFWLSSIVFFSVAGFFLGFWVEMQNRQEMLVSQSLEQRDDIYALNKDEKVFSANNPQSSIPVLHLVSIENGVMHAFHDDSEIRIILPNEEIIVSQDGKLEIPVIDILPMLQTLPAPEGMQFVASKRGSNYWALDTPNAFLLSPKNRIFFKDSIEAEAAGKKRGER